MVERGLFREWLTQELPQLLREDPSLRAVLWDMLRPYFADRQETESRFEQMLAELRQLREDSERRWQEMLRRLEAAEQAWQRKWEENQRRWEEQQRRWEENQRRWEEQQRKWEENQRRWEEQQRKWEEQQRKWEENQEILRELMREIKRLDRRIDITIGALGARWGLHAESAFRNALAAILQEVAPGVQVLRVVEWDDRGEVFGRPDQVELDLILKNGDLIIGEIKSSMSKADMYSFERKARFYERRHKQKAKRLMVISPMVEPQAHEVARQLGIEVYTHAEDAASTLQ